MNERCLHTQMLFHGEKQEDKENNEDGGQEEGSEEGDKEKM